MNIIIFIFCTNMIDNVLDNNRTEYSNINITLDLVHMYIRNLNLQKIKA